MKTLFHRLAVAVLLLAGLAGHAIAAPHAPAPAAPGTAVHEPAAGRFLVASRGLADPNFARSVVLLLRRDADGAMGITFSSGSGWVVS